MKTQITLEQLFRGHEKALREIIRDFKSGKSAREVAGARIGPIITGLEKNAGQDMDPTYIAYMIQHLITK